MNREIRPTASAMRISSSGIKIPPSISAVSTYSSSPAASSSRIELRSSMPKARRQSPLHTEAGGAPRTSSEQCRYPRRRQEGEARFRSSCGRQVPSRAGRQRGRRGLSQSPTARITRNNEAPMTTPWNSIAESIVEPWRSAEQLPMAAAMSSPPTAAEWRRCVLHSAWKGHPPGHSLFAHLGPAPDMTLPSQRSKSPRNRCYSDPTRLEVRSWTP